MAHLDWFWSRAKILAPEISARGSSDAATPVSSQGGPRFKIEGRWEATLRTVTASKLLQDAQIPVKTSEDGSEGETEAQPALATYEIETRTVDGTFLGNARVTPKAVKMMKPAGRNIPARFLSPLEQGQSRPLAHVWSNVEDRGEDRDVVGLLRSFDSRIEAIRIAADELGRAAIRIHHDRLGRMPIEFLGSGVGKALAIACHVSAIKNGVFVVDEIDASLDIGAQTKIIEFFMHAAQEHNVQVFASTHSIETLDAFLDTYAGMADLFKNPGLRILQVAQTDGRTVVKSIPAEQAKRLREDLGFDLRRTE